MTKKKDKEFVTLNSVTIPAGTTFKRAPDKMEFVEPHYSVLLGMGKDHTAELIISESAMDAFPGKFIIRNDGIDIIEN